MKDEAGKMHGTFDCNRNWKKFLRYNLHIVTVLIYELDCKTKADKVAPLEQTSVKYIDVIFLVWSQIWAKHYTAYTCHGSAWTV